MGRLDGFFEIGFGGPGIASPARSSCARREASSSIRRGEFDPYARRVLCANAHIGADFVQCLRAIPDGPGEPQKPR